MKTNPRSRIDRVRHEMTIDGKMFSLSPLQFELLAMVIEGDGALITRPAMMKKIWKHPKNHVSVRTVDQHIHRLRKTLLDMGIEKEVIMTVPVLGYKYNRF